MFINSILHKPAVRSLLPESSKTIQICTSFEYLGTIGSKIGNYNNVLAEADMSMIDDSTCDCGEEYSKYIDSRIGHVHTGQLDIIENQSLREIMQFEAKFRFLVFPIKTAAILDLAQNDTFIHHFFDGTMHSLKLDTFKNLKTCLEKNNKIVHRTPPSPTPLNM